MSLTNVPNSSSSSTFNNVLRPYAPTRSHTRAASRDHGKIVVTMLFVELGILSPLVMWHLETPFIGAQCSSFVYCYSSNKLFLSAVARVDLRYSLKIHSCFRGHDFCPSSA